MLMMKKCCLTQGWGLLLLWVLVWWAGVVSAEPAPTYPFNATGELTRKPDSVTLLYRLDLQAHRPQEGIIGHLKVFDARNASQPLVDFSLKQLADLGEDEMQVAFLIPGPPGKAASFFRKAQLVYDPANQVFLFHPVYRSTPGKLDEYLAFPVDRFRLEAHLRTTSERELEALQTSPETEQNSHAQVDTAEVSGWQQYVGDGTWRGTLRARDQLYKTTGFKSFVWGLVVIWVLFLVWMFPRIRKSGQFIPILVVTFCFLCVNFDGIYPFWIALPGFMITYPRLYTKAAPYSYGKVLRLLAWCMAGTFVILWAIFYQIWGWTAIREGVGWVLAGVAFWYFWALHLDRSCCRICGEYGRHRKLSEKLVMREVQRSRIHHDTFDHTEVRSDEIIDWYKRKYGVRIDIVETFNVFYECRFCGHIFKNKERRYKHREKW